MQLLPPYPPICLQGVQRDFMFTFEVLMAMTSKNVFWNVMPCSLIKILQCFAGNCCLHLPHRRVKTEVPGHFLPQYVTTPQKKIIFTNNLYTKVPVSTLLPAPLLLPMPRTHAIEAELHFQFWCNIRLLILLPSSKTFFSHTCSSIAMLPPSTL